MLTSDQLDALTDPIVALYTQYESSIINDIARRLGKMGMSSASAWQMQRLLESGSVYKNALKEIAKLTNVSETELAQMFKAAGVKSLRFDDSIYKAAGLNPLPLNLSPAMAQVLAAGLRKTQGILSNLTRTTAINAQQSFIKAADLAYMQVINGAMSYDQAIQYAVKGMANDGLSVVNYASGHVDKIDVATRRAVLTGVSQTTGQLQIMRADQMGVDLVQTSAHGGARPSHQLWQGKIFSRSGTNKKYPDFVAETGYGTGPGLMGWNCVLGDTLVSGTAIRAAYRRKYTGEIIILRTSRGHELTVTPNHPILTDKGWVAAGLLAKGDNVISRADLYGVGSAGPNINKNEIRIENVFNSLAQSGNVLRFPASSGYFHGDISDDEIEIVFPKSLLRDRIKAFIFQHKEKIALTVTSKFSSAFTSKSAIDKVLFSPFHTSNGSMGGGGKRLSSFNTSTFKPNAHGFRSILSSWISKFFKSITDSTFSASKVNGNGVFRHTRFVKFHQLRFVKPEFTFKSGRFDRITKFIETLTDNLSRTTKVSGNVGFSHSPDVQLDKLIFIERKLITSTHVYNLQTKDEWYFANAIITHNCRHSFFPFFEGISENAYNQATLDDYASTTVKLNGQDVPMYDATQYQRGIERKIRYWKRQADALGSAGQDNTGELARVKEWQSRARAFVKETGLYRQPAREKVYLGKGRMVIPPTTKVSPVKSITPTIDFEERIVKQNYETAGIFSPDGKLIFEKTDNLPSSVSFTNDEISKMTGTTVTHNHPRGSPFSRDDISLLAYAKIQEIHAVGKEYNYVMQNYTFDNGHKISKFQFDGFYETAKKNVDIALMGKPYTTFSDYLNDIWTEFAKISGLTYKRIPR